MMEEFVTAAQSGAHEAQGWPNTAYGTSKVLFTFFVFDNAGYLIISSSYNKMNKELQTIL